MGERRPTRTLLRLSTDGSASGVEASLPATGWVLSSALWIACSGGVWYDGAQKDKVQVGEIRLEDCPRHETRRRDTTQQCNSTQLTTTEDRHKTPLLPVPRYHPSLVVIERLVNNEREREKNERMRQQKTRIPKPLNPKPKPT